MQEWQFSFPILLNVETAWLSLSLYLFTGILNTKSLFAPCPFLFSLIFILLAFFFFLIIFSWTTRRLESPSVAMVTHLLRFSPLEIKNKREQAYEENLTVTRLTVSPQKNGAD